MTGSTGHYAREHVGEWRRSDDARLQELAQHLTPDLRSRLVDLVAADSRAITVHELEQRVQRAEDLANECRRQLRARERQVERLKEAVELADGEREDLDTAHGVLLGENVELEASLDRVHALLARWDVLSKGESETTRAIRAAISGDGS